MACQGWWLAEGEWLVVVACGGGLWLFTEKMDTQLQSASLDTNMEFSQRLSSKSKADREREEARNRLDRIWHLFHKKGPGCFVLERLFRTLWPAVPVAQGREWSTEQAPEFQRMIRKAAVHCDHKRHTNKDTPEDMDLSGLTWLLLMEPLHLLQYARKRDKDTLRRLVSNLRHERNQLCHQDGHYGVKGQSAATGLTEGEFADASKRVSWILEELAKYSGPDVVSSLRERVQALLAPGWQERKAKHYQEQCAMLQRKTAEERAKNARMEAERRDLEAELNARLEAEIRCEGAPAKRARDHGEDVASPAARRTRSMCSAAPETISPMATTLDTGCDDSEEIPETPEEEVASVPTQPRGSTTAAVPTCCPRRTRSQSQKQKTEPACLQQRSQNKAWAELRFADGRRVEVSTPTGVPFVIGGDKEGAGGEDDRNMCLVKSVMARFISRRHCEVVRMDDSRVHLRALVEGPLNKAKTSPATWINGVMVALKWPKGVDGRTYMELFDGDEVKLYNTTKSSPPCACFTFRLV